MKYSVARKIAAFTTLLLYCELSMFLVQHLVKVKLVLATFYK